MKVCFLLVCGKDFGGMERRFTRLACHLYELGYEVQLACYPDAIKGMAKIGIEPPDGLLKIIGFNFSGKSVLLRKISRLFGLFQFSMHCLKGSWNHIHVVANPGAITYIYSIFKKWLPPYSFSVVASTLLMDKKIVRHCVKTAKAVDCLSETIGAYVKDQSDPAMGTSHIYISPCSFTDYSNVKKSQNRDIDVVMMARFSPEKGFDLMLEALPALAGLEIHLCGFGGTAPDTDFAKIYRSDNPFDVLSRAKIFVSLQEKENYPSQSLLEAMASGCAIVASDVGETRRLLDDTCGVLISRDADSLVKAITCLTNDPSLCQRLGNAAERRVRHHHTIEKFAYYFRRDILQIPEASKLIGNGASFDNVRS